MKVVLSPEQISNLKIILAQSIPPIRHCIDLKPRYSCDCACDFCPYQDGYSHYNIQIISDIYHKLNFFDYVPAVALGSYEVFAIRAALQFCIDSYEHYQIKDFDLKCGGCVFEPEHVAAALVLKVIFCTVPKKGVFCVYAADEEEVQHD